MRISTLAGAAALLGVVLALAYLVGVTAVGWEDWLELGAIAVGALMIGGALFERRTARRVKNPTIRRTPESQW